MFDLAKEVVVIDPVTLVPNLKFEIKTLAADSVVLRKQAQDTSGAAKQEIHVRKKWLGAKIRIRTLAYAMLRGKPYLSVECNSDKAALLGVATQLAYFLKTTCGKSPDGSWSALKWMGLDLAS